MSRPDAPPPVSLVIPGRDAGATIGRCLDSVVGFLDRGELAEIVFVDDGSTDDTADRVAAYPAVRTLRLAPSGRGAARNAGWRAARGELIWFIDADCVAEPGALAPLLKPFADPEVDGVGGSFNNLRPGSVLACLIHEEIVERHLAMVEVNHLATGNAIYRRAALERVGGFDETLLRTQDMELAYRVRATGGGLRMAIDSRVGHHHDDRLGKYLNTQRKQGYWRMWLYERHPDRMGGDDYSGLVDHAQPPLAMAGLGLLPLFFVPHPAARLVAALPWVLLVLAQIPMTARILRRKREPKYLLYVPFGVVRAVWRGLGLVQGVLSVLRHRLWS